MSPANSVARLRFSCSRRSWASLILFDVVSTVATAAAAASSGGDAATAVMTLSAYSSYSVMLIIHSLVETITYHHIFPVLFFFFLVVCRFLVGSLFGMFIYDEHWLSAHNILFFTTCWRYVLFCPSWQWLRRHQREYSKWSELYSVARIFRTKDLNDYNEIEQVLFGINIK